MDELKFAELGRTCVEHVFRSAGCVKRPVLLMEAEGILVALCIEFSDDLPAEELHEKILNTVASAIREHDLHELFVGYEGFVLRQNDTAVRILVGIYYSDEHEQFWVAQTHGSAIGEWREAPVDTPRCGFEGLWSRAKSHLRN